MPDTNDDPLFEANDANEQEPVTAEDPKLNGNSDTGKPPKPEAETGETKQPPNTGLPPIAKDEAIHNSFMLGWQIVELKSRIRLAYDSCVGSLAEKTAEVTGDIVQPAEDADGKSNRIAFNIMDASIWRSLINKLAGLQKKAFIVSPVAETLYEPPSDKVLPYLYPPTPDYANVGIPNKDNEGAVILEKFTLYDVTRRAINCLTLLYLNADEALIPDRVTRYQNRLIGSDKKAAENAGAGGGAIPTEDNMSEQTGGRR